MGSELTLALLLLAVAPDNSGLANFEEALATRDSATLALQGWCATHHLADLAIVRAKVRARGWSRIHPAKLRTMLRLRKTSRLAMRNVDLSCGDKVLSVAWNWYVQDLLTPDMKAQLETTDTPFGKVVASLHFRRESLEIVAGPADSCPRDTISTHRARLVLPDGRPLAYVVECYTPANLGR